VIPVPGAGPDNLRPQNSERGSVTVSIPLEVDGGIGSNCYRAVASSQAFHEETKMMGWEEADRKYKKFISSRYVILEDRQERLLIRQIIREEFPNIDTGRIDAVVDQCGDSLPEPLVSEEFFQCVIRKLK
jgi:hypothetical protein